MYELQNGAQSDAVYNYVTCAGVFESTFLNGFENLQICAQTDSVNGESIISINPIGTC